MKFLFNILYIIVLSGSSQNVEFNSPSNPLVVETNNGYVKGEHGGSTMGKHKHIYRFRSIPYAEQPIDDLRFEPPVPKRNWSGILNVGRKGAECVQGSNPPFGSEDCLFIKIYTTEFPSKHLHLPVMVWIYGGGYFFGAPDFDDHSPDYLLDEGVIIVSFHYRTGIMGFMTSGDMVAPGNYGLKDQVLALKWIKANIKNFGGDPDNITLFGQSAGAASIGYLLQNPQATGLFHRAILMSGGTLCQWALSREAKSTTTSIANDLGVKTDTSQNLIEGLKSIDAYKLQEIAAAAINSALTYTDPLGGLPLGPTIEPDHEGAAVTGQSYELLKTGQFHHVPIIIGHTSMEAMVNEIPDVLRFLLLVFDIQQYRFIPASMNIIKSIRNRLIGRQIKQFYFQGKMVSSSTKELLEFISDDQFVRPIQESARLYSKYVPVYYYEFSHAGHLYGITERKYEGVAHNEDLGYVFDFGYPGTSIDYTIRQRTVKMWTNFAKTGNPTPYKDFLLDVLWIKNRGGHNDMKYLDIRHPLNLSVNPRKEQISFWRSVFEKNGVHPYDTY